MDKHAFSFEHCHDQTIIWGHLIIVPRKQEVSENTMYGMLLPGRSEAVPRSAPDEAIATRRIQLLCETPDDRQPPGRPIPPPHRPVNISVHIDRANMNDGIVFQHRSRRLHCEEMDRLAISLRKIPPNPDDQRDL